LRPARDSPGRRLRSPAPHPAHPHRPQRRVCIAPSADSCRRNIPGPALRQPERSEARRTHVCTRPRSMESRVHLLLRQHLSSAGRLPILRGTWSSDAARHQPLHTRRRGSLRTIDARSPSTAVTITHKSVLPLRSLALGSKLSKTHLLQNQTARPEGLAAFLIPNPCSLIPMPSQAPAPAKTSYQCVLPARPYETRIQRSAETRSSLRHRPSAQRSNRPCPTSSLPSASSPTAHHRASPQP